MNAAIAHRGPDADGAFVRPEAAVGLAHRRLAIVDLSEAGAQPMWDASGTAVIVYNGELYNSAELRSELAAEGVGFRGHSDTEVLVNLYRRRGRAMLARLNGIYAFAIFDTTTDDVLVARDRFGVKPLYYAEIAGGVLFASELKALLACPDLPRRVDEAAALAHLVYLWSPAPRTILEGVVKLDRGCAMLLRRGRIVETWRYHDQPIGRTRRIGTAEAVEAVRAGLRRAVERQMMSDVPFGAFLSGGLDSSAVVAFARQASGSRLPCFSMDLAGADAAYDGLSPDLPYARTVARHLDVDLHVVEAGPQVASGLERMIYHLDEPQADPAALNVMMISELARANGIKVLLSGTAGDDLFTGYRRHRAYALERWWSWLPRPARAGLRLASARLPARRAPLRRLRKAFAHADRDADHRLIGYFQWLSPDIARSLMMREPPHRDDPLSAALAKLPRDADPIERMLALECRFFLTDHNLAYTDKMSMAAGVEVRVPFLDNDLVDLASSLPSRLKQRGATGKWVLKKAMEGILPDEVIYRPKTGFGVPLRAWLRGPLAEMLGDVLSPRALRERGLFDPASVARLIADDRSGRIDASYPLFSMLCTELWCQRFIDSAAPEPPSSSIGATLESSS